MIIDKNYGKNCAQDGMEKKWTTTTTITETETETEMAKQNDIIINWSSVECKIKKKTQL